MTTQFSVRLLPVVIGSFCAATAAFQGIAAAQAPDPAARLAALRAVRTACAGDYPKFCPVPAIGEVSPRDQAICLKYFKPDLSLGCRGAVNALAK